MTRKAKRPSRADDSEEQGDNGPGERLQKVLAASGVGSRRDCEELITAGRIEVDRQVITELGTRVDPLRQEIRVDGEALRQPQRLYYAVNKPVGVVTTNFDPAHRERVIDLVPTDERVFAVGRIDRSSEGLILVTNDGEFANRVTHPRYGVEKTYLVRVAGAPNHEQLAKLKRGVHLAEGYARAQSIAIKKKHGQSTDLMIVLNEGRNREIRRILARVGHKVLTLKRVAIGPIKLGDLPLGGWRRLMPAEIESLLLVSKEKRREAKQRKKGSGVKSQESEAQPKVQGPKSKVPEKYLQKQALLAEPLSLEDLLRDDLDEGPIGPGDVGESHVDGVDRGAVRGGVIDYAEAEGQPPSQPVRPQPPRTKPPRTKPSAETRPLRDKSGRERRPPREREQAPREDFGKKRGGKRIFNKPKEGSPATGKTAAKSRFRPQKAKAKTPQVGKRRGGPSPFSQERGAKQGGRSGRKRRGGR